MKYFITFFSLLFSLACYAKDFAWVCAIEWSEKKPEWVFVYEDIKLQSDGNYRVFVKWEFDNNDPNKHSAKQVWLLSPDFDQIYVLSSVGYNDKGQITFSDDDPYGEWFYVLPDTYAEAVVDTSKEILLKK